MRRHYAAELQGLRRRNYLMVALVVVIDADTSTVDQRLADLDAQAPRTADDRVAIAIPRRNIETWIRYFLAPPVDEATDYKRTRGSDDAREAASRLARLREAPADAPDSLRRFFAEIARITR